MSNILRVRWPRPHPVWGKFICAPARLSQDES